MAKVTLTAYDMGPNATEADFDSWAAYVNEHIDEKCGFPVAVEQFRFANSGEFEDAIEGTKPERRTISEALRVLYDEWCASGAPAEGE